MSYADLQLDVPSVRSVIISSKKNVSESCQEFFSDSVIKEYLLSFWLSDSQITTNFCVHSVEKIIIVWKTNYAVKFWSVYFIFNLYRLFCPYIQLIILCRQCPSVRSDSQLIQPLIAFRSRNAHFYTSLKFQQNIHKHCGKDNRNYGRCS